jgi:hypothetical protein
VRALKLLNTFKARNGPSTPFNDASLPIEIRPAGWNSLGTHGTVSRAKVSVSFIEFVL